MTPVNADGSNFEDTPDTVVPSPLIPFADADAVALLSAARDGDETVLHWVADLVAASDHTRRRLAAALMAEHVLAWGPGISYPAGAGSPLGTLLALLRSRAAIPAQNYLEAQLGCQVANPAAATFLMMVARAAVAAAPADVNLISDLAIWGLRTGEWTAQLTEPALSDREQACMSRSAALGSQD